MELSAPRKGEDGDSRRELEHSRGLCETAKTTDAIGTLGAITMKKETDAQRETWELKDAAWKDVAHLPLAEAFAERRRASMQTVKELGLEDRVRDPRRWKDPTVLPKTTQTSHN